MKRLKKELVTEFIEAFEQVFHKDWAYTKDMLGMHDNTQAQHAAGEMMGLETIPVVAEDGTFLQPRVEDEKENWGYRGRLLELYRELKQTL